MSLEKCNEHLRRLLADLVREAVVFVDEQSAECLHWLDGVNLLYGAGALNILDIYRPKECLESEIKAVFIVSVPLGPKVMKAIEQIVSASDFQHCTVVSTLSLAVNEFILYKNGSMVPIFGNVSKQLKAWMQNEFATAVVCHIPLFTINVAADLFITPAHGSLFPPLPSDVARLQGFIHSMGDKRTFNHLGEVDLSTLPHNLQARIKMLASSMNSVFTSLDCSEDCYAVGHFSKLIGRELANMPEARARRKMASSAASIIFMDRTLDLVSPMKHSDCVLDTVFEILPRLPMHRNDVAVDMSMLFSSGNITPATVFPGCLAHHNDRLVQDLLKVFASKSKKDCIVHLCGKIKSIIQAELPGASVSEEKPSLPVLCDLLLIIRNNQKIFEKYSGFLQGAVAFVNTFNGDEIKEIEEMIGVQKIMMLNLGNQEVNPFSEILSLVSGSHSRFSVVDVLRLTALVYSLGSDGYSVDPFLEEKLKECCIKILLDGEHKEDLLFIMGDVDVSERRRVADMFERLKGLALARLELQDFRSLMSFDDAGKLSYVPLAKRILENVISAGLSHSADIEFCSQGIRDLLKSGFGFFMNVSKPRPSDNPLLILFIVGGITWDEVRIIREAVDRLKGNKTVIVGSTRLVTPSDMLEQVLCADNLFDQLDV